MSLTITNIKSSNVIKSGIVEHFFAAKSFSDDIVANMLSKKMNGNKQKSKKDTDKKDFNKITEFLVPSIVYKTSLNFGFSFNNVNNGVLFLINYLSKEIEYPLKIPFWLLSVFLLLLIKILFNVLPRSISVDYNKMYIEGACIV
ncbi:hypothetical protein [Candidatus Ruminimicrobiellum ovillum]|uniref:hypothetical protein n=1 Tax=Candidatus Ruminimicrobiellum ovillum TaxID=1947927 RepID=UPI003559A16D